MRCLQVSNESLRAAFWAKAVVITDGTINPRCCSKAGCIAGVPTGLRDINVKLGAIKKRY